MNQEREVFEFSTNSGKKQYFCGRLELLNTCLVASSKIILLDTGPYSEGLEGSSLVRGLHQMTEDH